MLRLSVRQQQGTGVTPWLYLHWRTIQARRRKILRLYIALCLRPYFNVF